MAQFKPEFGDVVAQQQADVETLGRRARQTPGSSKLQETVDKLQAAVELLDGTVDYLSSLRTLSSSAASTVANNTGTPTNHPEQTPTVQIELPAARRVKVTLRATVALQASGTATNVIDAAATMSIRYGDPIDSTTVSAYTMQSVPAAAGNHSTEQTTELTCEFVGNFNPGTHIFGAAYFTRGSGASVLVSIDGQSITAQILGLPE